jgi:hypothetical protein
MTDEEPKRREWDRRYRETHKEQIAAYQRERQRLTREKAKLYDLEHGK